MKELPISNIPKYLRPSLPHIDSTRGYAKSPILKEGTSIVSIPLSRLDSPLKAMRATNTINNPYTKQIIGTRSRFLSIYIVLKTFITMEGSVTLKINLEITSPSLSFKIPVFFRKYPNKIILNDIANCELIVFICRLLMIYLSNIGVIITYFE